MIFFFIFWNIFYFGCFVWILGFSFFSIAISECRKISLTNSRMIFPMELNIFCTWSHPLCLDVLSNVKELNLLYFFFGLIKLKRFSVLLRIYILKPYRKTNCRKWKEMPDKKAVFFWELAHLNCPVNLHPLFLSRGSLVSFLFE